MEVKVCGMRQRENILRLVSEVNPDWMGLIFYPKSPRFVADELAAQIDGIDVKKVGVFVNENLEDVLQKIELFRLSAVQLHGNESVGFVGDLSQKTAVEIWKVVSVKEAIDWDALRVYLPFVSKFLFDTATTEHGGSGKKFNWDVLKSYPFETGFLLSGGLDEESVAEVLALSQEVPQLEGVDLNSRFEDAPGLKNVDRLKNFKTSLAR